MARSLPPRPSDRVALGPGREFDLIRSFLPEDAPTDPRILLGPGDDAAVLDGDPPWVVTCDASVEEVHFRRAWLTPREVGWRAGAAALSDLAAMAAEPVAVLVSLAIPVERRTRGPGGAVSSDGWSEDSPRRIQEGIREVTAEAGGVVVGGDVTRSPGPLMVDVLALGRASRPLRRDGARPGDRLWVTGRLGAAAAAVAAWIAGRTPLDHHRRAYARPVPRVSEAIWLSGRAELHAGLDLSDGLVADAGHLAAASGVGVEIELAAVPAAEGVDRSSALSGGEDFELLLAAPRGALEGERRAFEDRFGIPLTPVGRITEGRGVRVRDEEGREVSVDRRGWDHLASDAGAAP